MDQDTDEFHFEKLVNKISHDIDFHGQYYGEKHLKRRFMVRMRATGTTTFREYIKLLDTDPTEYDHLLKILTVNVTEWFRNPEAWEYIKDNTLAAIIQEKKGAINKSLRIWSAGSSDGKEAYTIAILLHEILGDEIKRYNITILATDIDEEMLTKGRIGLYKEDEMKGITVPFLEKYFTKTERGYQVRPFLKSMVRFQRLDLITDKKYTKIDLLFCRNVVIYFTKELKETLYMEFYNSINPGGYFVMGKTETLLGDARTRFKAVNNRERVYIKPVE